MEKLLILGINTRPIISSALKLNYQTYSSSYYNTADTKTVYKEKYSLQQKPYQSCGMFEENFNFVEILNNCSNWIEGIDHIVLTSGISPEYFNGNIKLKNDENIDISKLNNVLKKNKKKIVGNKNIEDIENKYRFYKKMKNKYSLPLTFKLSADINVYDTLDIVKQYDDKKFIIKELSGSGGYGINFLNNESIFQLKEYVSNMDNKKQGLLLQEYVDGDNLSCSVLGTENNSKSIIVSKNINNSYYQKNEDKKDFRYSGNISPINRNKYNSHVLKEVNELSESMISDLNLIGSNGVDLIVKGDEINVIEVNPRFQGTYESVEDVLGINLLETHIKACDDNLINVPSPKNYSMKKIIYASRRLKFNTNSFKNLSKNITISDIPYENTIIEKNQPMLTLTGENSKIDDLKRDIEKANNYINLAMIN
ncbi:MAG: ATP-grasp domain-containing protein [Methanobrevibacter sp.]|jgi:predicted ATP-grasp superfamily ATP-dependent carboligase|nr:ATP-grasp domain-containing protein [Candidatus Methanovirga australis]